MYYPSEQAKFLQSIAVVALMHKKNSGYYMDRIHTKRNSVLGESNIQLLYNSIAQRIQRIQKNVLINRSARFYYPQNSGNKNSVIILAVSKSKTTITVGRTILLPFLIVRPAPM